MVKYNFVSASQYLRITFNPIVALLELPRLISYTNHPLSDTTTMTAIPSGVASGKRSYYYKGLAFRSVTSLLGPTTSNITTPIKRLDTVNMNSDDDDDNDVTSLSSSHISDSDKRKAKAKGTKPPPPSLSPRLPMPRARRRALMQ